MRHEHGTEEAFVSEEIGKNARIDCSTCVVYGCPYLPAHHASQFRSIGFRENKGLDESRL